MMGGRAKSLAMRTASLSARIAWIAAAVAAFAACARAAPEATLSTVAPEPKASEPLVLAPPADEPAPALAPAPSETQRFGAPIGKASPVALADVAKSAKSFKGKSIVTTGTVAAVCQERGCWMEIKDEGGDANVRMHGHAFFLPKSASGKKARVEGTVVLMKDGKECDEMASTGAQLELDATGVELM